MGIDNTATVNRYAVARMIGEFNLDSITNAPLQIEVKFKINVPQDKAFKLVFNDLESWFKEVEGMVWNNEKSMTVPAGPGVNSKRECGFGGKKIYEKIVFYDPPNGYGYAIDMKKSTLFFPAKDHMAIFLVESNSSEQSTITWRQYFNKTLHPMSLIINPMFKNMGMKKNIKNLISMYGGSIF